MVNREHACVGLPDVRMCMGTGTCEQMAVLTTDAIATHDRWRR